MPTMLYCSWHIVRLYTALTLWPSGLPWVRPVPTCAIGIATMTEIIIYLAVIATSLSLLRCWGETVVGGLSTPCS